MSLAPLPAHPVQPVRPTVSSTAYIPCTVC
nr:MAG TPA: hypothetical protein [Caudoviricetes sp.]